MNLSKFHTFLISLFFIFNGDGYFTPSGLIRSLQNRSFHVVGGSFSFIASVFILSELLIGFGIVKFVGLLLEPFMRPIFRVPGVGGFVLAMGMASGNPAGAKLTARLRQDKQISRVEAERLVSFTNSSNPLFIFAAVAVGFFITRLSAFCWHRLTISETSPSA